MASKAKSLAHLEAIREAFTDAIDRVFIGQSLHFEDEKKRTIVLIVPAASIPVEEITETINEDDARKDVKATFKRATGKAVLCVNRNSRPVAVLLSQTKFLSIQEKIGPTGNEVPWEDIDQPSGHSNTPLFH